MNCCNIFGMHDDNLIAKRLAVLGHPIRLAIIRHLVRAGPPGLAAGYMGERLGIAPNALTFHLKKLAHVGVVTTRREGRFILYSAEFAELLQLVDGLIGACCADTAEKCGPACPSADAAPRHRQTIHQKEES